VRAKEAGFAGRWNRPGVEGLSWYPVCDVARIRASPAFLNEYVDILSRIGSMIQFAERRSEYLEALKAAPSA
jgi:hypothetical protein